MEFSALSKVIAPTLSRQLFMMAKQYDDVIDFTLGDPDIPTPKAICEAAFIASNNGQTHYAPNAGLPALREAIAKQLSKESGIEYTASNVAVTIGATEAVYMSFMTCINPGDEVIILAPYWVQYENIVKLLGGKPIVIDTFKDGFEPDLDVIRKAINEKTKAIVVNSPNNPSGYVYNASFLAALAEMAIANHVLIIDDEAYRSLVYDQDFTSIAGYCRKEDVVIINSFSKQFAMTGWRVGYVVADENFINAIVKFQQNIAVCVATPNQYAAIEAISNTEKYAGGIKDIFAKRRDVLIRELNKIDGIDYLPPQGTFYAFIDISRTGMDSKSFCFGLLEKKHVAVIPGVAFGKAFDGFIRLAFTLHEEKIVDGISKIHDYIIQSK
ncbi:MAG: pyridoxal phosphate-dependent aminotransferase [Muribaculaceae bacterium]|nr:pyridoxal phosphate-dependent aminotransferase [Muribaculaceae bacterium]